ncbi:MAG: base excision DNA repair protein [Candidatus Korobacteraceae bacterium]
MKFSRTKKPEALVRAIWRKLAPAWGPQHWWPAETAFEVIVGAILVQNTSWSNVERALGSLRSVGILNLAGIREAPLARLQELVRSSGYYRQKAERLKNFVTFLDAKYCGSLEQMFSTTTSQLRTELLSLKGIGAETADAILLYAGNREIFVVDAYAQRILLRHEAINSLAKYDEIRSLVERALNNQQPLERWLDVVTNPRRPPVHAASAMSQAKRSPRAQIYNEMHGLLVQVGKHYCYKEKPDCEACPLRGLLPRN